MQTRTESTETTHRNCDNVRSIWTTKPTPPPLTTTTTTSTTSMQFNRCVYLIHMGLIITPHTVHTHQHTLPLCLFGSGHVNCCSPRQTLRNVMTNEKHAMPTTGRFYFFVLFCVYLPDHAARAHTLYDTVLLCSLLNSLSTKKNIYIHII